MRNEARKTPKNPQKCGHGFNVFLEELHERGFVEQRLGLLIEERLVGRAAALGHKQKLVAAAFGGVEINLRGQIGFGVCFVEHVEWRYLQ